MEMSVSQIIKKSGKKTIYVQFSENNRIAEGIYPENKITKNDGFTSEEIEALELYMSNNSSQIEDLAKTVSLWKAFS